MLTLNLLPPEQKENLNYEIARRISSFFGFWLSAVLIIFGVLILPVFFLISLQQSEVARARQVEEEALKSAHIAGLEEEIYNTEKLLDVVLERGARKKDVSPFIGKILAVAPPGVSVTLVGYEPSKSSATVIGTAATRSAFLKFIDILKAIPEIKTVSSPVSNIIRQQDINFSIIIETES